MSTEIEMKLRNLIFNWRRMAESETTTPDKYLAGCEAGENYRLIACSNQLEEIVLQEFCVKPKDRP